MTGTAASAHHDWELTTVRRQLTSPGTGSDVGGRRRSKGREMVDWTR